MYMLTIEEMKEKKRLLGYSYQTLSERSGVPVGTLQKIFGGYSKAPREKTLRRLSAALEQGEYYYASGRGGISSEMLRETAAVYAAKKQGEYTLEDYLALPDEKRVELIDGVFYDMGAPRMDHQLAAGQIHAMLLTYITQNKGTCVPFIAPADVQLDCDDRTIVQPDIFVVCDRSRINGARLYGAPDFVIEILSPSTSRKDRYIKLSKYKFAGVREYWLVDLRKQVVIVNEFDANDDDRVSIYSFSDQVPVGIYNGECRVDFAQIREYIRFITDREE